MSTKQTASSISFMDHFELEEILQCEFIVVPRDKALEAAAMISGWAEGDAEGGNVPFDWFLAAVMGHPTGRYECSCSKGRSSALYATQK